MSADAVWKMYKDIDVTSANIHDGLVGDEALMVRAKEYVGKLFSFDDGQMEWMDNATVVDIGGGHGWLMREVADLARRHSRSLKKIIDLDISDSMLSMCRSLNQDQSPFEYISYDGVAIPLPDESVDCFYSAACIQHIPKHLAYNLFIECFRALKRNGVLTFHVLSTKHLPFQEQATSSWRQEIKNQISGSACHWHHFYSKSELEDVLSVTGFGDVSVVNDGTAYCVVAKKSEPSATTLTCDVCSSTNCRIEFVGEPVFYRCSSCGSDTAVAHEFTYTPRYLSYAVDERGPEEMIKDHTTNVDIIKKHSFVNAAVLDIGCFRGYGMEALRRAGFVPFGFDVVRYSSSERNIAIANTFSHSMWSFKFDAIMCREVFEHVQNWQGMLAEMWLALRDGGVLMIQTPVPTLNRHPIPHQSGHLRVFSHGSLRQYIEAHGFDVVDSMLWDIGQIVVAKKRSV